MKASLGNSVCPELSSSCGNLLVTVLQNLISECKLERSTD